MLCAEPNGTRHALGLLHIAGIVVLGLAAGAASPWIYPAAAGMKFGTLSLVAVLGALAGGVSGGLLWRGHGGRFHPLALVLTVACALFGLWLYLYVKG
jgi:hypothetical protein